MPDEHTNKRERSRRATDKVEPPTADPMVHLGETLTEAFRLLIGELHDLKCVSERHTLILEEVAGALRDQNATSERNTKALEESSFCAAGVSSALGDLRVTMKALAHELGALRQQRAKGGNGHAKQDDLSDDHNEGDAT